MSGLPAEMSQGKREWKAAARCRIALGFGLVPDCPELGGGEGPEIKPDL